MKVKLGTKQLCRVGQSSHSTSYALLSASSSWLVVNLFFFFFFAYNVGIIMRGLSEVTCLGVHGT